MLSGAGAPDGLASIKCWKFEGVCVCVRSVYPGDVSCFIGLENEIAFPGKILLHDSIIEKRTNVRNRNRPRVIIFGKCWQQQQPTYLRRVCVYV